MGVARSIRREIKLLGPRAAGSVMAETALALARGLDGDASLTSKSMAAKSLIDVMRELRSLVPAVKEDDELARLRDRRDERLAGLAAASDLPRP